MIEVQAQALLDDTWIMGGKVPKKHFEDRIKNQLAHELAHHLVAHHVDNIMVSRPWPGQNPLDFGKPSHTQYDLRVVLFTPDEAKEYTKLKKLRE